MHNRHRQQSPSQSPTGRCFSLRTVVGYRVATMVARCHSRGQNYFEVGSILDGTAHRLACSLWGA
jgi:hypothetical protein